MDRIFFGKNLDGIKDLNISTVIKRIYEKGGISRIELAESIGMSPAFVTKVLSQLTSDGIIIEEKTSSADRGRPKVALSFNYDKYAMLGLRINNKYISSALCTASGEILCHFTCNIDTDFNSERILAECIGLLEKSMDCSADRTILGIGIAAPGPLPPGRDRITVLKGSIFDGLSNVALTDYLEEKLGLPSVLWHDAYCGALNEYVFCSEDTRYHNIVFLATDNGVGAGIISEGRPFNGAGGFAGEVSNMLISGFDGVVSAGSIASQRRMLERCGCGTIEEFLCLVESGDERGCAEFDSYVKALSIIVANLVVTVSPEAVVISDRIAILDKRVYGICRSFLDEHLPKDFADSVEIRVRPYSKHSVLRGACGAVLHMAFDEPCKFFLSH